MFRAVRRPRHPGRWLAVAVCAAVALTIPLLGQNDRASGDLRATSEPGSPVTPTGTLTPARSPRNASYTITATLDHTARTLTASEVIAWRNISAAATSELRFHVYWNAWRNTRSTFLRERALVRRTSYDDDDFARVTITRLTVTHGSASAADDRLAAAEFIAPDDGNQDDATVLRVPLTRAVAPGEELRIEVGWTARIPRPFARTGVIGDFHFIAQWFPKLGVLEDEGWNCHQFHANTEFFADFGVYDVSLTVPAGWLVGATGVERQRRSNGDGTVTHVYHQDDVHDFAWTTSPSMLERVEDFVPADRSTGQTPVRLRLLLQPEHSTQAAAHFAAARTALTHYSAWAGPYPYDQLTIVDPAFQSEADGMEYPTLITAGTPWLNGSAVTIYTPEEVVVHETGHQFFYGVVATNEFEDAWMDEGLNTYLAARALAQDFPHTFFEQRYLGGFLPWVFEDLPVSRETYWNRLAGYRRAPKSDLPSMPSYRYSIANGRTVTYNKTALWLNTLERHLGWPVMQRIFSTYYGRWQFRHPKPADFFAVINEVSGEDLTWFLNEVYRSSNVFDYSITTLTSSREDDGFRTDVIVSRLGEGVFPVDIAVAFEDGTMITERWDGRERWRHFTFSRDARAVSATVDPKRVLLLDVNQTNNSRTLRPAGGRAATKWSLRWMVWLEQSLLSWVFFI
ncbi:MAG: M1 family metallopeptidase [Vicinamibacterales bacterium]